MSDGNGNGNGKAFVLSQPKTAEQIQREEILATMPKLRRECSRDPRLKRCVGAKWLFGQLSDLTFLHNYGGDGFGRLYISIKDLKRIFGHDEGTIAEWRDKLLETGWIWFRDMWPKSCWGIIGVCRQPELFPPNSEFIREMVKGDNGKVTSGLPQEAKTPDSLETDGKSPGDRWRDSHSPLAGRQRFAGRSPAVCGNLTAQKAGESPPEDGRDSHTELATFPRFAGRSPVTPLAGGQHIKETPGSNGGVESNGGALPSPTDKAFEDWKSGVAGPAGHPTHRSKLEKELGRIQVKLMNAGSEQKNFWQPRANFIRELLDGGKPPVAPKPVRQEKPKATVIPLEKRQELFRKAKAAEPALAR